MFSYPGNIIRTQLPVSLRGNAMFTALIFLLMLAAFWANYFTTWRAPAANGWHNFLTHFFLYLALFATPFFLQRCCYGANANSRPAWFYLILLVAPLVFACRVAFPLDAGVTGHTAFNRLLITRSLKTIFLVACTAGLWYGASSGENILRVFRRPKAGLRYLLLLLPMIPIIIMASFQPAFKAAYPLVLKAGGNEAPGTIPSLLYEFFYIADIAGIEFFFRGLLVVALTRICGPRAIIPAACFYCSIHFGKPMAEAISSFFGGLFLGLLSYHSKTIWACILLHAGIAILMDLLAFISPG